MKHNRKIIANKLAWGSLEFQFYESAKQLDNTPEDDIHYQTILENYHKLYKNRNKAYVKYKQSKNQKPL